MLRVVTISETPFRARVVVLGASNATRAISIVVETLRLTLGAPLEILAAIGHGRSYGMRSTVVFVRTLPSILECGLWDALRESQTQCPGLPTFALITDIGNDILYGASPQTVARWVEQCIDRLSEHQARIAMTMLPIESIRAVSRWQYAVVKSMLFPTRTLSFADAITRADQLDQRLRELGARRSIELIECQSLVRL